MAIPLYHEYAPSHPRFRGHYRITFLMTWIPIISPPLLMVALNIREPWFFGVIGVGLALAGLLDQGLKLDPESPMALRLTRRLPARDQWFPPFMVIIQGLTTIVTALLLWFAITGYLFEVRHVYNVLVVTLAVLFPFRRYYAARKMAGADSHHSWLHELTLLLFSTALILLAALSLGDLSHTEAADNGNPQAVVVWVIAMILVLFRVLMFLHRVAAKLRGEG
ncbi:MAG: hypothetical protein KDL31_01975 [Kiritimatiellae bacterium]|nr:hypothetical protein [Kiritimatiellia bacterium]